jgi:hypothetical protein
LYPLSLKLINDENELIITGVVRVVLVFTDSAVRDKSFLHETAFEIPFVLPFRIFQKSSSSASTLNLILISQKIKA